MRIVALFLLVLPGPEDRDRRKSGIPLTEAFETSSFFTIGFGEAATSATRRYTVGPMLELRLPRRLGMEFDVLYKRLGFDDVTKTAGVTLTYTHTSASSWEFPIVAKFHHARSGFGATAGFGTEFRLGFSGYRQRPDTPAGDGTRLPALTNAAADSNPTRIRWTFCLGSPSDAGGRFANAL